MAESFTDLLARIHACRVCAACLPHEPRPVLQAHPDARLLIVSQTPGARVHASGIPFDDKSGERLREWLGVERTVFYDAHRIAIMGMGFCYPGKGPSGDLPPRPECAPLWHPQLLPRLRHVRLTLAVGGYAIRGMTGARGAALSEIVRDWRKHLDAGVVSLPHPSPRNIGWFKANPWFEREAIPALRERVRAVLE